MVLVAVPVPEYNPVIEGMAEGLRLNVAVTVVLPVGEREQGAVPLQPPPLQPEKVDPAVGVAVSVREAPCTKLAEQVGPQLIPEGELMTVPVPEPVLVTVTISLGGIGKFDFIGAISQASGTAAAITSALTTSAFCAQASLSDASIIVLISRGTPPT